MGLLVELCLQPIKQKENVFYRILCELLVCERSKNRR